MLYGVVVFLVPQQQVRSRRHVVRKQQGGELNLNILMIAKKWNFNLTSRAFLSFCHQFFLREAYKDHCQDQRFRRRTKNRNVILKPSLLFGSEKSAFQRLLEPRPFLNEK